MNFLNSITNDLSFVLLRLSRSRNQKILHSIMSRNNYMFWVYCTDEIYIIKKPHVSTISIRIPSYVSYRVRFPSVVCDDCEGRVVTSN